VSVFDVVKMEPNQLSEVPITALIGFQKQAEDMAAQAAQIMAVVHATLVERYARGINGTGTTHVSDGGVDVTITIPKRVKWDQAELERAVQKLREMGEDPTEYVDHKLSVAESKYKAWPAALRDLFEPARTEECGKAVFKFGEAA